MVSKRHNAVTYCIYSVFLIFIFINFFFVDDVNPQKLDQVKVKLNEKSISDLKSNNEIIKNKYIEIDTLINIKKIIKLNLKKTFQKKVKIKVILQKKIIFWRTNYKTKTIKKNNLKK